MAYRYTVKIDATFMRFDPSDAGFYDKICSEIPSFKAYKEHDKNTRLRIFAWVVCMYDQHTPIMKEVKDLYKRKVYAASLAGISPNKTSGKYKEFAEQILLGIDEGVNDLIVDFISYSSSPDYKQLIAHVTFQDTILKKIISGTADKADQQMFDHSTDKIKELTNLLYGAGDRDEVYEARRALYQQVIVDLTEMRAESVAKRMSNGEGLSDEYNPYEGGYLPDDIKFESDDEDTAQ